MMAVRDSGVLAAAAPAGELLPTQVADARLADPVLATPPLTTRFSISASVRFGAQ